MAPDELKTLESVFAEVCCVLKISRQSADAENLALKIMLMHESGMDDRSQLLGAVIKQPDPVEDHAD